MNFPTNEVKSLEMLVPPLCGILLPRLMFIHTHDILLFRYSMFASNVRYKATLTVPGIRKRTAGKANRRVLLENLLAVNDKSECTINHCYYYHYYYRHSRRHI
jgi:hypothetical protein